VAILPHCFVFPNATITNSASSAHLYSLTEKNRHSHKEEVDRLVLRWSTSGVEDAGSSEASLLLQIRAMTARTLVSGLCQNPTKYPIPGGPGIELFPFPNLSPNDAVFLLLTKWWDLHGRDVAGKNFREWLLSNRP